MKRVVHLGPLSHKSVALRQEHAQYALTFSGTNLRRGSSPTTILLRLRREPDLVPSKDEASVLAELSRFGVNSPLLTGSSLKDHFMRTRDDPTRPANLQSYSEAEREMRDGEIILLIHFARNAPNVYNLRPPQYVPSFVHGTDATPAHIDANIANRSLRQISTGFWTVGGRLSAQPGQVQGTSSGQGGMLASGSTAPSHSATFLDHATCDDKAAAHERRLALALDIDQASRILLQDTALGEKDADAKPEHSPFVWRNSVWTREPAAWFLMNKNDTLLQGEKTVPTVPFRVLDAPNLKDDYYCSILAYTRTCRSLAVALGQKVYLWTEEYGVRCPPLPPGRTANFVTSLAFSSKKGGKAILAVARNSGTVTLWSLLEIRPRFDAPHPYAASCVSFKPVETQRRSTQGNEIVMCEDLLVGDDSGMIYYYSLEWPEFAPGSMTLLAKIDAHSQNICGFAWSPDGMQFVSGGNDNRALLFDPSIFLDADYQRHGSPNILANAVVVFGNLGLRTPPDSPERHRSASYRESPTFDRRSADNMRNFGIQTPPLTPPRRTRASNRSPSSASIGSPDHSDIPPLPNASILRNILVDPSIPGQANVHVHSFYHTAAVKAIAFAPWQADLLATGGGSNDRQIHFFHTESGATLALINVFSQVTSLV